MVWCGSRSRANWPANQCSASPAVRMAPSRCHRLDTAWQYEVYQTAKGRFALYVRHVPNWHYSPSKQEDWGKTD